MINISKKYRTKGGYEVRLYTTDGGGDYPVHGAILVDGAWMMCSWKENGTKYFAKADGLDLVEIVEPKTVWIILDDDGWSEVFLSEDDAAAFLDNGLRTYKSDDGLRTYKVELTEDDIVGLSDE